MEVPLLSNIKIFRERLGLTQRQLAEKVGIGQPYIAKIESGKQNPSYDIVAKIFAILNMELQNRDEHPLIVKTVATPIDRMVFVKPKDTLRDVKRLIGDYDQIPVLDTNLHCVGSVTSQLLIRLLSQDTNEKTAVKDIMGAPLPSFSENTPIKQIRNIFRVIDAGLIVDRDQITGIVTRSDVF
jgi:predicted transcriptional regulator